MAIFFREKDKVSPRTSTAIEYVRPDAPPILIMHGDADDVVPYEQSVEFFNALRRAGNNASMYKIKGAGHNGFTQQQTMEVFKAFFDEHLK